MSLDTAMHNIEITCEMSGQLAKAVGVEAKLIANEGKSVTLRLPSREVCL
jgi:large subunit ribosomal protein L2